MKIDIYESIANVPNATNMTNIGNHSVKRSRDNYTASYVCLADFGSMTIDQIKTRAANQSNILAANSTIRQSAEKYNGKTVVLRIDTIGTISAKQDRMLVIESIAKKCIELGLVPIQALAMIGASGIVTDIMTVQSIYAAQLSQPKSDSPTRPGLTERQLFNPTDHDHDANADDDDADDADDVDVDDADADADAE